ncbi:MAG: class II aldolase/adducin family protein [Desulfobulbaceae bacterium]|nr:class II aldolase/adducin family protein [Desulfobulbaceae bacterium]
MIKLVDKYARKMIDGGLADNPLVGGLDDEIVWNRRDELGAVLEQVMAGMNINSLICAIPAEPYKTILQFLAVRYPDIITPRDCETRTFLHDLPVTGSFSGNSILQRLKKRKSVIVADQQTIRVVAFGTVSPEQAFVTFGSVCFSSFVLFFSEYLAHLRAGTWATGEREAYAKAISFLDTTRYTSPQLMNGPFTSESQVIEAMIEAGRLTVDYGLVDSYFGNISYRLHDTIYISQTGSSLDELAGCIDPCPMDGSSCAGVTASSELVAHSEILLRTDKQAVLHGHPKFAVILSMDCELQDCPDRDKCHIKCSRERFLQDIPIIPGEVGTGPTGLCNTLPPAIQDNRGAIVWGHGLFTVGKDDFNEAFRNLLDIENMCRAEYLDRVRLASC